LVLHLLQHVPTTVALANHTLQPQFDQLRGEEGIATIYRREGISHNLYYRWSKFWRLARSACWVILSMRAQAVKWPKSARIMCNSSSWWLRKNWISR
jgi:hypothetical protein